MAVLSGGILRLTGLLCLVSLLAASVTACSEQSGARPLVAIREGLVRGVIARSITGRLFYSFKGIRYARPPVGELRFQPPQRHPAWSDVADGLAHGNICPQIDMLANSTLKGDEDCLFANVYTPRLPRTVSRPTGGLPVMVFIHGGGFNSGSGDDDIYGPTYFMDEDVVLVTFNYRLGPLGFFSTNDAAAPGNYGLRDQVLLLQWVQDNIAAFGGDPHAVTIFGESAGGVSVSLLVLSPLARGLFHHAISQSGSALSAWVLGASRDGLAERLAGRLDCPSDNVTSLVECVKQQPFEKIIQNVGELQFPVRVDQEAANPVIPDDPRALLLRGQFNLVPWMTGVTQEEGALFAPLILRNQTLVSALYKGDLAAWSVFVSLVTQTGTNKLDCGADVAEEARKVYDFYIGDGNTSSSAGVLPLVQSWGDRLFIAPIMAEAALASRHAPVYQYLLDHLGPGRLSLAHVELFLPGVPDLGTTHGDDILYLFSNDKLTPVPRGSETHTMVRLLVSVWATFARTGRPGSHVLPMPDWPVYTEQSQRHMRLNSAPSVGERLFEERVNFWQTVPINEPWRHVMDRTCQEGAYPESV